MEDFVSEFDFFNESKMIFLVVIIKSRKIIQNINTRLIIIVFEIKNNLRKMCRFVWIDECAFHKLINYTDFGFFVLIPLTGILQRICFYKYGNKINIF
jgi:hypothetical protein